MKPLANSRQLSRVVVKGFKSIADCDLDLGPLNILIGSNGSGKSNFIGFFHMIQQILLGNLQMYVSRKGGPEAILHFGRKTTEQLQFALYFRTTGYLATLEPTLQNRLMFSGESLWESRLGTRSIGSGHLETSTNFATFPTNDIPLSSILQWMVYHLIVHGSNNRRVSATISISGMMGEIWLPSSISCASSMQDPTSES